MSKVTYFVNDQTFYTDTPELTVSDVLERAGESPDQFYLVLKDIEYRDPSQKIEIHEGDRFQTKPRDRTPPVEKIIHYKVNGEEQTTERDTLTVEEILRSAGRAASIDVAQINDYYLESLDDGRKYEDLAEQVSIKEGDQFLAIHRGKTPVA